MRHMVWVKDYAEDNWEGHAVDGFAPSLGDLKQIVAKAPYMVYDRSPEHLDVVGRDRGFVYALSSEMSARQRRAGEEDPSLYVYRGGRKVFHGREDFYMLNLGGDKSITRAGKSKIVQAAYAHLEAEWRKMAGNRDYRQIVVFTKDLPETEDFLREILDTLNFRIREPGDYIDDRKFEEAVKWVLSEEGFYAFVTPCLVVEDKFKELNFDCVRDF